MDKSNHSGSKMWQNLCFEQIKNVAKFVLLENEKKTEKKTCKLPNSFKFEIPTKKQFQSHESDSFTANFRLNSDPPYIPINSTLFTTTRCEKRE